MHPFPIFFPKPANLVCYPSFFRSVSTCGVIASIIACVQRHKSRIPPCPDDSRSIDWDKQAEVARETEGAGLLRRSVVILPRDAHKSAVHGLVISGATPCFLAPVLHPESGVRLGIGKDSLKAALEEHGDEVRAEQRVRWKSYQTTDVHLCSRSGAARNLLLVNT